MKQKQTGFTAIEGLLVTIIILMIGFIGYYVYNSQQSTDKTLDSAADTNQTVSASAKTDASKGATSQKYVTITQWNVRAPYTGTLNLSYTLSTDGGSVAFTSKQLLAADSQCTRAGTIVRATSSDQVGPDGSTAPQLAAQGATVKQVGSYYYVFDHDQAACSDKDTATTLQSQTNDAVKALVPNLVATPK